MFLGNMIMRRVERRPRNNNYDDPERVLQAEQIFYINKQRRMNLLVIFFLKNDDE